MEALEIAKNKIENGAKFNGIVYSKNHGKNYATVFIYLGGEYFKLDHVQQKEAQKVKKEMEKALCISTSQPVYKNNLPNTISSFATTTCDVERTKAIADFHSFCEGED